MGSQSLERDEVDRLIAAWKRERPDLDLSPLAVLLHPVMPATTEILWESLGAKAALGEIGAQPISGVATWGQLPPGATVTKTPVLFPRLEVKE